MNDPRIAFFDRNAQTWDTDGPDIQTTLTRLAQLESRLELAPGMNLLEVGCGTGQITQWLADQVQPGRVLAVDFSTNMLEKAREKGIPAEFRQVDVCSDALVEKDFDRVLCFHSFPHFRDQHTALRNLAQSLKPDGRFLIVHLAGSRQINDFHDHVGGAVTGDHLPKVAEWDGLLAQADLRKTLLIDQPDLFLLQCFKGV